MANVLLIEPDRVLAKTYFEALQLDGHITRICSSAQSAISCADEIKPDFVILELQLVSHSGIEFLYEFRSYPDWQNVPVIILSNVPPMEFSESVAILQNELGVSEYFYKPSTSLEKLRRCINQTPYMTAPK